MAVLTYFKKLSKTSYFYQYVKDEDLMQFLDGQIRKVNPAYSLQTTLTELAEIDQWKSHLKNDAFERLRVAPSLKASIKAQMEEIKQYLVFDKGENNKNPAPPDKYLNEPRNISYNLLTKGDNVTLKQLGYLMLHERWQRENEEEHFLDVGIITSDLVKIKINAIAEGAAFCYHLPFLEELLKAAEKNDETKQNKDDLIFYAQTAHRLYTGDRTVGAENYSNDTDFIEAMHAQAEFPGIIFYENLALALPGQFGSRNKDLQTKEILAYCQEKIKGITSVQRMADLLASPEKQIQAQRDMRRKLKTLPLLDQKDYYETQLRHFVNERKDVLYAYSEVKEPSRLDYYTNFYHAQIEDAKIELDYINRELAVSGTAGSILVRELYVDIIKTIYEYGRYMEQNTSMYIDKNEEALRTLFVGALNTKYGELLATAESYNKAGKTDILVKSLDGENVFIGECKIWDGQKAFMQGLDQLIERYTTWRDVRTGLLLFVTKQNFSAILESVKQAIKNHQYLVDALEPKNETSLPYLFRLKEDPDRRIALEVIVFPFPEDPTYD